MNKYEEDIKRICEESLPFHLLNHKSILITGANGLIGSCIVDVLMKLNEWKGYEIQIFALCRNQTKAEKRFAVYLEHKKFHLIFADITDPIQMESKCEYIIHAASNAHPLAYAKEPVETMKANLLGMINLLEYARRCKSIRTMFISSSEIYGENISNKSDFTEEDCGYINSMKERSCYPESKRAAETLCVCYDKQYDLETVIARLGYIYGIRANESNTRADIQFMKQAENGQNIILKSSGLQRRSYCYLSDAVCGLFYILLLGKRKEVYNIANRESDVTIREFAYVLAEKACVQVQFENPSDLEMQGFSNIKNAVLNADKLKALGWNPRIGLQEGTHRLLLGRAEMGRS